MRKIFTLLLASFVLAGTLVSQNTRYIDEVFTDVVKLEDQVYSVNITVVTGAPALDTLLFDLYMPAGDTCTLRPLAVVLHTGTFLPRGVFSPTGDKDDYANVQICERLAKQGYVAASIQYRVGWNPISPQDTVRRSTIINAAYRSIQDMYAFLRFMNMTVVDLENPYKIDPERVAVFGVGTGGFVGFNAAVLEQSEIYIEKFTNPAGASMIDTNLVGDLTGQKPGLINIPNHVGYSHEFHFVFGLDGAVGDSSWMEDGKSVPLVAGGTVTHPTTPYGIDPISGEINCELPVYAGAGTGSFVVNIGGSVCMIEKANSLGINNPLKKTEYTDPVSEALRNEENTFGQEHLWAINLPGPQTGPWEFWDSIFWNTIPHPLGGGASIHQVSAATNPDMSQEKADRYIDTSLLFFSPRAYITLNLGDLVCSCDSIEPDLSIVNDFECQRNFIPGTGSDKLRIVDNPYPNDDNPSAKVGLYSDPANDPWAAICFDLNMPIDLSARNQFMFQVRSTVAGPILCKLEGGTSSAAEVWLDMSGTGEWETLTADFSSEAGENHEQICLLPNGGVSQSTTDIYLFDNLRMEMETGLFSPRVESLQISPNPVSESLYIRNSVSASRIRVMNVLGQTVLEQNATHQHIITLSMHGLDSGIYLVGAYDADGHLVANARVMKN